MRDIPSADRDELDTAWLALADAIDQAITTPALRIRCALGILQTAARAVLDAYQADVSATKFLDAVRRFELARIRLFESGHALTVLQAGTTFSRLAGLELIHRLTDPDEYSAKPTE